MGFLDYARMIRARWWVVLVATVLGAAASFAWVSAQPAVYTATGSAVVTVGVATDLETAEVGDRYAKSLVLNYLDVAESRKVGEYAAEALGLDASGDSLVGRVSVDNPEGTASLQISAEADSPEEARDLVEAWIAGTAAVMKEIETGGQSSGATSVARLETLDNAGLPTSPSSPDKQRAVTMGAFAGLVLGVGATLVWGALDRRLRRRRDVEQSFSLPVLGLIPLDKSLSKSGVAQGGGSAPMKEALRALRTNLQFIDVDNPPRVLVVTSSLPGDGKSTISYKLADVIAALGRDVILVDADLRRPRLADYLGIEGSVGLTDVLVGRADVDDALQDYGDTGHLRVLAAGQVPPNPSELVASEAMQHLLYSFPEDAVVLVDSPPLVPVTDAAVLAARTDGALVVARAGRTTVDVLDRALANLERVEGRPFGVILNGVALKGVHRESYAHHYYEAPRPADRAGAQGAAAAAAGEDDAPPEEPSLEHATAEGQDSEQAQPDSDEPATSEAQVPGEDSAEEALDPELETGEAEAELEELHELHVLHGLSTEDEPVSPPR